MYAWKLGKGSVYKQEWPYNFGNVWGTEYNHNKPSGNVGYIWEDWSSGKVHPYKWQEYDANNSLNPVSGNLALNADSLFVSTNVAGDINMFFEGPNMKAVKNYTINGKIRFSDASAEFGIDFYGQWPQTSRKFSIIRKSDKVAHVFYSSDSATSTDIGSWLSEDPDDSLKEINKWYNFEITISPSDNKIKGWFWKENLQKPENWALSATNTQIPNGGLVGLTSHSGTGNRFWGPIKVVSNEPDSGAYLAFEDFKEDTIVDVKPYTPAAFHPDYTINQFTIGNDNSGFVLDTTGFGTTHSTALVYRHKPGTQYSVTCRIAPYTNLEWRDYQYSGTIIKPAGTVYDSVVIALPFYYVNDSKTYILKFAMDGIHLLGPGIDSIKAYNFSNGDIVNFRIAAKALPKNDTTDRIVSIVVDLKKNNGAWEINKFNLSDESNQRIISGYSAIQIDLLNVNDYSRRNLLPIQFKNVAIQKAE
jgi:hypothetical protein